ncbi:MAG: hypothetical protein U0R77_01110 [Mycolicibacterium insubricum]|nr:hypothetical protein [Mycobacterium sp.]
MRMTRVGAAISALLLTASALSGCGSNNTGGSDPGSAVSRVGKMDGTFVMELDKMRSAESGKEVPGSTAVSVTMVVRSSCPDGCIAGAAVVNPVPNLVPQSFLLDFVDGAWQGVERRPATCGDQATEEFKILTLTPSHDGGYTGLFRSLTASNNGCNFERPVTVKRIGNADPAVLVPDPSILPDRVVNRAAGLRGNYRFQLKDKKGAPIDSAMERKVQTYCVRTAERCMSLITGDDRELVWTLTNGVWSFTTTTQSTCADGRKAERKDTATFPLPNPAANPIATLTGSGSYATAEPCPATTDFDVTAERIGD